MKKTLFLIFLLSLISGLAFSEDNLLGEKKIAFKGDVDTILVGASEGLFKFLIFKVTDNDVSIDKVEITYGNKDTDVIPVKWIFKEDDRSRLIDLEGNNRFIKKIVFNYKTIGEEKNGKATLKVFGIKSEDIEKLGERIVKWKAETDTIPVTSEEGLFRSIVFKVAGNDIEILKMTVTYGNGEVDDIPVKWTFTEGDQSRLIDLVGKLRVIKKIDFFYKTSGEIKDGKATVQVFGLH